MVLPPTCPGLWGWVLEADVVLLNKLEIFFSGHGTLAWGTFTTLHNVVDVSFATGVVTPENFEWKGSFLNLKNGRGLDVVICSAGSKKKINPQIRPPPGRPGDHGSWVNMVVEKKLLLHF